MCAGFVHFSAYHTEDCEGLADSDVLREGVRAKYLRLQNEGRVSENKAARMKTSQEVCKSDLCSSMSIEEGSKWEGWLEFKITWSWI